MDDHLHVISWNISGLTDLNKKLIAKSYLSSLQHLIHILMLQELKADKFHLDTALQLLVSWHHQIVAYPPDGKGGAAILIHSNFTITSYGIVPGGSIVQAHIKGPLGEFCSTSIYGIGTSTDRSALWRNLCDTLPNGGLDYRR